MLLQFQGLNHVVFQNWQKWGKRGGDDIDEDNQSYHDEDDQNYGDYDDPTCSEGHETETGVQFWN